MFGLVVLARIPVMAAGAVVGGATAGTLYPRLVWAVLHRHDDSPSYEPEVL